MNLRRLLIVEDDPSLGAHLTQIFNQEYLVELATTLAQAQYFAQSNPPDLVILDLHLPDGYGSDFLAHFRTWSASSVLILSAQGLESEKVKLLDLGADDFINKPFGILELQARVRALLRRSHPIQNKGIVCFGANEFNPLTLELKRHNQVIHLTKIEIKLLEIFCENIGKLLTHRFLLTQIWGPNHEFDNHYLRIYMKNLRQKCEDEPNAPKYFITELGLGYRFVLI